MQAANKKTKSITLGLLAATLAVVFAVPVQAESLFYANVNYQERAPMVPKSLFTPPISRNVGDLVTIIIEEESELNTRATLNLTREQNINQNGSGMYNSTVRFFLDKLPFNTGKIADVLSAPDYDGLNNQNVVGSRAVNNRNTEYNDNITCQVVQVLPNGDLMVQGHKTVQANKERTDLIVTGIVKPYYLDRNNEINSRQVANFQLMQGGKGVISRQMNDGIANKIYQFFN